MIAFHRWDAGAGDDVVVVVNLSTNTYTDYRIGMPHGGLWKLRFNSDAKLYSSLFGDHDSFDVTAFEEDEDGMGAHSNISVGPYSVLIYSQDA